MEPLFLFLILYLITLPVKKDTYLFNTIVVLLIMESNLLRRKDNYGIVKKSVTKL